LVEDGGLLAEALGVVEGGIALGDGDPEGQELPEYSTMPTVPVQEPKPANNHHTFKV
jgi:hypothetical protein